MNPEIQEEFRQVFEALQRLGCHPRWAQPNVIHAHCPAHDDKKPSLYITAKDDKLLFHCFAGCPFEAIIAHIGPIQTRPSRGGKDCPKSSVFPTLEAAIEAYHFGKPSSMWAYFRSGESNPCFYVFRWNQPEGKEIRPICKVDGGWKHGYPEGLRPLWNLPAIEKAPPESWVVVCEGEPAAEAATACGLLATTSAGGANAAAKTDWTPVHGRRVLILPDNDTPGRRYAKEAAQLCREAGAKEVKVLDLAEYAPELPESGDIVDVLASPNFCGLPLSEGATPQELGAWILATATKLPQAVDVGSTPLVAIEDEPQWTPLPWEPYPIECLPPVFANYVLAEASCLGCDPAQIAVLLLVAAGSAIGTTRAVKVKQQWQVFAILWAAVIGESGTLKTPAYQKAIGFVQRHQRKLVEKYERECQDYEIALQEYEARLAKWKRNPDGEPPPEKPFKPVCQRVITNDTTIEAVGVILRDNPRGLLLACDELSTWLRGLGRYLRTGGREAEIGHWTSLYHGHPLHIDRKTTGFQYVPMGAVSIAGLIQPRILQEVLSSSDLENGIAARFLFVRPPCNIKQWTDNEEQPELVAAVEAVFSRLYELEHVITPEKKLAPRYVTLSPEALEAYKTFYNWHNQQAAEFVGPLRSALAKLEELPIRLALILHLVRWASGEPVNPDIIAFETMDDAIRLTEWHIRETHRFYDWLHGFSLESRDVVLLEWIARKGGETTVRELVRGVRQFRGRPDDAEAALQRLVELGFGAWKNLPASQKGGRPTRVFRLLDTLACRRNLKNSRESRGFVDVDTQETSQQEQESSSSPNVIPPESGTNVVGNISPIGENPTPGEWVHWRL